MATATFEPIYIGLNLLSIIVGQFRFGSNAQLMEHFHLYIFFYFINGFLYHMRVGKGAKECEEWPKNSKILILDEFNPSPN
jgi:hypothetical protein